MQLMTGVFELVARLVVPSSIRYEPVSQSEGDDEVNGVLIDGVGSGKSRGIPKWFPEREFNQDLDDQHPYGQAES
jgi:hypothetical protein